MRFQLREYQTESIDLLRKTKGIPILCLPTGAGKTVTFSHLAEQAINKGNRVHVVCHRKELIQQAAKTMRAYGITMSKVSFGMVQTYNRSPHKIPEAEVTIIDECHIGNFRRFVDTVKDRTFIIGATATPIAASKKHPLNKVFDEVVCPVQISDLIDSGYLSRPVYHLAKVDTSGLQLNSVGEYSESSQDEVFSTFGVDALMDTLNQIGNEKTIIFTPSVKMAEFVADRLDRCYLVHSKMKKTERDKQIEGFQLDPLGKIVNCSILTAGFDDPEIKHVVLFRATTSEALYLQMVGRGSRVANGKNTFHVWDLGNNYKRIAYWHADRDWPALFSDQGKRDKIGEAPFKNCVNCEALIPASARTCEMCEHVQPVKKKEDKPVPKHEFEVVEYGNVPAHLRKPWDQMNVKELLERATYGSTNTGRPFKIGWVLHQIKQRQNSNQLLHELARLKGYKQGWVKRQLTHI